MACKQQLPEAPVAPLVCSFALFLSLFVVPAVEATVPGPVDYTIGYGGPQEKWMGKKTLLSWSPRLYHLKGFLSDSECDHLKQLAKPQLKSSRVVDSKTGMPRSSTSRTSKGAFIRSKNDPVVATVEKRVAAMTMLSLPHQESLHILKYENGQKYLPHHDYFAHEDLTTLKDGGQRYVTLLMYLSTPLEGGETVFPMADAKVSGPGWSDCARGGFAVKAQKGDAIIVYNLHPNGTKDVTSLHGSCPTTQGEKWSATKWIRARPRQEAVLDRALSFIRGLFRW